MTPTPDTQPREEAVRELWRRRDEERAKASDVLAHKMANAKIGQGSTVRCEGPTPYEVDQMRPYALYAVIAQEPPLGLSASPAAGGVDAGEPIYRFLRSGDVREALAMAISWIEDLPRKNASHQMMDHVLDGLRASLAAPASTNGYTANCCKCDRIVDTRETTQGGDAFGCEITDGRWACSPECREAVTDPDASPTSALAMPSREWMREKIASDPDVEDCGAVPTSGSEAGGGPPNGYHPLPPGIVCKCMKMWQDGKGNYWCCQPVVATPAPSPAGGGVARTARQFDPYILKAMAENYAGGHCWDHLDGQACLEALALIESLQAQVAALSPASGAGGEDER